MFCGKCGAQMEDHDQFCPNCGEPRVETESVDDWGNKGAAPGANPSVNDNGRTWILDPSEVGGNDGWDDVSEDWDSWGDTGKDDSWGDEARDQVCETSPKPNKEPLKRGHKSDPSERHELIILTRAEAMAGCKKTIEVEGSQLTIEIPPNITGRDTMAFRGYGYHDPATGERGVLKIQFLID